MEYHSEIQSIKRDQVFASKLNDIRAFEFDEAVAAVFDDMVSRSVPFYHEIHRIILDLIDKCYQPGSLIYDLGCSTGTTIEAIAQHLGNEKCQFIGIDNSSSMIKKCQEKMSRSQISNVELICGDLIDLPLDRCGMVIMNYTLQFIDRKSRL